MCTSRRLPAMSSLARCAITDVASVSAGPPCGGLYLKPPSVGGLCEGVTTMPSASPEVLPAVGAQDRVRDRRRRGVPVAVVDQHRHVVGRQHLDRGGPGRLREPVGVAAEEQRAVVPLLLAVVADRLGGREDVRLVERRTQRGAAMAAGAEGHLLVHVVGVGDARVVGRHQVGDVDQVPGLGGLTRTLIGHADIMLRTPDVVRVPAPVVDRVRPERVVAGCTGLAGSPRLTASAARPSPR